MTKGFPIYLSISHLLAMCGVDVTKWRNLVTFVFVQLEVRTCMIQNNDNFAAESCDPC